MGARAHSGPLAVGAVLLLVLAFAVPGLASIVVPIPDDDLIVNADVVVMGRVTRIESHRDTFGEISSYITLGIDETLKGALSGSEVTLRERGGKVGNQFAWMFANPEFAVGERVLVFLNQRSDGTLRSYHLFLGKFTIVTDPASGELVAARGVPRNVTVVPSPAAAAARAPAAVGRRLDDFTLRIRQKAGDPRPPSPSGRSRPVLPMASANVPPTGLVETHQEFRFLGDPNPPGTVNPTRTLFRWAEPDSNTPVTLRFFQGGEPTAQSLGFDQLRLAMRAWSRVPTSSFRWAEGPLLSVNPGFLDDGLDAVSFRDPLGEIADPSVGPGGCSGILAIGGVNGGVTPTMVVNGRTFVRVIGGDLVFNNGWDNPACGGVFYQNFSNFTEVATHELGHVLGLGHSEQHSTFDPVSGLSGATMSAFAHFDGRMAGLHADDRAGVTFIYPGRTLSVSGTGPGSGTITSGTDGISCTTGPPLSGDCVAGFAVNSTVTLNAVPAAGSTFAGFMEPGCGPSVVMSQDRVCTALFTTDPELLMTVVTLSATTASPGSTITVDTTVRNGGVDAGPFGVGIYLSNTSTVTTASRLIATRSVAGLAFNQTSAAATQVTIPADTPPGTYFIGAIADYLDQVVEALETNNARVATGSILIARPDLVVTALTAPTTTGTGRTIVASATVGNPASASVAAGPSTLAFYLSSDATLGGGDRRLAETRAIPGLNRNATSAGATTLTIPPDMAPGNYFLIAQADDLDVVGEQNEANNTRATATAITVRRPDLTVLSVTAPAVAAPGMNVSVTHVVRNLALAPGGAPATVTRLSLSSDALAGGDTPLLDVPVGPIAGGGRASVTRSVPLPGGLAPGRYWIVAQANVTGIVIEASTGNNAGITATPIVVGPDLTVAAGTVAPVSAAPGQTVNVASTVRNQGGQAAGAFAVGFFLSTDATFDSGSDVPLGTRPVPGGLASSAASTPLVIPAGQAAGAYFIVVRADSGDAVGEADELNNVRAIPLTVVRADLAVQSVTVTPGAVAAGANVSVTHVVRNIAAAAGVAGPSTSRLYLSADATLGGGDVALLDVPVGRLAGMAQTSLVRSVQIPPATPAGLYRIIAEANALDSVVEADMATQANNVGRTATTIIVGPDLTVSAATAAPVSTAPGMTVNVSQSARNQGGGAAGPFTVGLYLSGDAVFDPGTDVLLASRPVAAGLAPAATSTATTPVPLPGNLAAGTYFLIVRADIGGATPPNDVPEADESNNVRAVQISVIRPDLTVPSITAPATAPAGANVSVTHVVRNGAAAAGAAPASVSRLFLSTDNVLDGGDVQLGGDVPVAALAGMAQASLTRRVQIPPGTPAGLYFIVARSDATGVVTESDEGNNTLSRSIAIGPDVTLTAASTVAGAIPGATINVAYTLRNLGAAAAGPFNVAFVLVPASPAGPDIPMGPTRTGVVLAAGGTLVSSTPVQIPGAAPAGTYRVRVVTDAAGAVPEAVEGNNAALTGILTIQPPDLVLSSIAVPSAGVAGRTIGISNTVINQATAPGTAPAFQVGLYLGASAAIDPAVDTLLATRALGSLGPNVTSTGTTMVTLPTATGSYFLGAVADRAGVVIESDETNNIQAGPMAIVPEMLRNRAATANITLSSCSLPENNGSTTLSGRLVVSSHTGLAWSGRVSLPSNTITLTGGTVDAAGNLGGSFTVVNAGGARGGGTFTGTVVPSPGGAFAAIFTGAFNVGETCAINASLSAP